MCQSVSIRLRDSLALLAAGLGLLAAAAAPARAQSTHLFPTLRVPSDTAADNAFVTGDLDTRRLAVGDLDRDGLLDLVTLNPTTGAMHFMKGLPEGAFGAPKQVALRKPKKFTPETVAIADVTGDGHPDVVVGGSLVVGLAASHTTINVLSGGQLFGPDEPVASEFPELLGESAQGQVTSALGDLNGDGRLDIVLVLQSAFAPSKVQVGLGDGSGGFALATSAPVGAIPMGLALGDYDGDGHLDVALTTGEFSDPDRELLVFLGTGDGHLGAGVFTPLPAGLTPQPALASADLDHDGRADLVIAMGASPASGGITAPGLLATLGSLGDGHFAVETTAALPPAASDLLALGDMNGDQVTDFVVAERGFKGSGPNLASAGLTVVLGAGGFAFGAIHKNDVGVDPCSLVLADFDADGALDAALGNRSLDTGVGLVGDVGIAWNRGDGSFPAALKLPGGAPPLSPSGMTAADLNGDGLIDLVSTDWTGGPSSLIAFIGDGSGAFPYSLATSETLPVDHPTVGDIDGDGIPDLVYGTHFNNELRAVFGHGFGTFGPPVTLAADSPDYLGLDDIDGDGIADLLTSPLSEGLGFRKGNGNGTFQSPVMLPSGGRAKGFVVADLDGDGVQDIAVANGLDATVGVLKGAPGGPPVLASLTPAGLAVGLVVAADINRDGQLDLVVVPDGKTATNDLPTAGVLLGSGNLAFSPAPGPRPPVNTWSSSLLAADVDRDGFPDVLCTQMFEDTLTVLLGQPDGTLAAPRMFFIGDRPVGAAVADLDGDGFTDIAVLDGGEQDGEGGHFEVILNQSGLWANLGHALGGAPGALPHLAGAGQPSPDQLVSLTASGLPASALGLLFIGLDTVMQPYKGGLLVPHVDVAAPIRPDLPLTGRWPDGLGAGTPVYFQAWFATPAQGGAISATNALVTLAQ